jgi:DNA-binding transcriptional LysR family regulator
VELELRHLRIVCAIAEAGSVTKAAAALGLAQPALTTQLQRIERILGGALFTRDRRGVHPTALGDLVLARARVLIPAMSGLHTEASELITAGDTGRFRVGASNGPIVGGLIQRLTDAHPDGQVSVHTTWSENEIGQMVSEGRLDYALVGACANAEPAPGHGLTWTAISMDPVWVLLEEAHPLAGRAEVELAELATERWVTAPGDGCFNECFAAACARSGFAPRSPYVLDVGGALDMVAAGKAVALAQGAVRSMAGVVAVPLTGSPLRWRHLLGWDPESAAARRAGEVASLAAEAYLDVVGQRPKYAQWLAGNPRFGVQHDLPEPRDAGATSSAGGEHAGERRLLGAGDGERPDVLHPDPHPGVSAVVAGQRRLPRVR